MTGVRMWSSLGTEACCVARGDAILAEGVLQHW